MTDTSLITQKNPLILPMQGFVEHLRMNGFNLGPKETEYALSVISKTIGNEQEDQRRLKALLASSYDDWKQFDVLFEAYWHKRGKTRNSPLPSNSSIKSNPPLPKAWRDHLGEKSDNTTSQAPQVETLEQQNIEGQASGRLIASEKTGRAKIDFRQFVNPMEIAEAEALAYKLALAIRYRLSRRRRIEKNGRWLDFRRTIHANIKHGGDMIELRKRSIPDRPVRIVVFLDVSGSMKHYSRFFLQFVKGLVCQWVDSDAFLFHTKLIRVTDAVRDNNSMRAMTKLSLMAEGFGGGTKLGECLGIFNETYAKKALNGRTVVMILSDGYEVGPAEALAKELQQIKKRAKRLIWLNPLLGWRNYEPITAAMTAALPYIDHFSAANTLNAMAEIEPELAKL
ncbi:vWA domain-containing protein [Kiloniella antarctica]|uniref:VWA domain-containing protein n=1 Tax=Kiloniella antarctica TaxID=1550907 RepID=A0ABW5BKR8_9PROT